MHSPSARRGSATAPAPPTSHTDTKSPPPAPDTSSSSAVGRRYSPLAVRIPTHSIIDDDFMAGVSFSKRGSIMFSSSFDALALDGAPDDDDSKHVEAPSRPPPLAPSQSPVARPVSEVSTRSLVTAPDIRVLSPDVEKESQKVRSLYETGDGLNWEDGARHSYCERLEPTPEVPAEEAAIDPYGIPGHLSASRPVQTRADSRPAPSQPVRRPSRFALRHPKIYKFLLAASR